MGGDSAPSKARYRFKASLLARCLVLSSLPTLVVAQGGKKEKKTWDQAGGKGAKAEGGEKKGRAQVIRDSDA